MRATGITHSAIRQINRARRAAQRLKAGALILDVVDEVGYYDQAHHTHALQRLVGLTPAQIARGQEQLSLLYNTPAWRLFSMASNKETAMLTIAPAAQVPAALYWTGWVISVLLMLFLVFDGVTKIVPIAPVIEACEKLGIAAGKLPAIGIILLACTLLYAIPPTRVLGGVVTRSQHVRPDPTPMARRVVARLVG